MKVLFVSQYAGPSSLGSNNNVYRQAKALKQSGIDIEILTWPEQKNWSDKIVFDTKSVNLSPIKSFYEDIAYHIVTLPEKYNKRVLRDSEWNEAVEIGCGILKKINPAIVHLQHWRGLWWILEAANRLNIPTVFTSHDWGLGCLRTILVKSDGKLCNGVLDVDKCSNCIRKGRNILGCMNEFLVSSNMGEKVIEALEKCGFEKWLITKGAVHQGVNKRFINNYHRAKSAISKLEALIVPSEFAKEYYLQFGIDEDKIHIAPWYYDMLSDINQDYKSSDKITLGYIGRISLEKGVDKIFDILHKGSFSCKFNLLIAGAINNDYAQNLYNRFKDKVGNHSVEWMGWISHEDIHRFYEKVDVVIIPSEWMDNTPLTLIESFAFKKPVIITNIPSIRDIVHDGKTGYLTDFGSVESLKCAIKKIHLQPEILNEFRKNIPSVISSLDYSEILKNIYHEITKQAFVFN